MKLSYFEVVDEEDNPLGIRASYDEVHDKGFWHRGIHVLVCTPDKQIIMQKRAPSLRYHPNEVEISVGGGVDAGETPAQATVREIKEELGLDITPEELHYIGKKKFNHATKGQLNRYFLYSYWVCVPRERLHLSVNPEETDSLFLLTERQLKAALRRHRIRHVGRITSTYAYWDYLLEGAGI